jgi:hypothetical protein
MENHAAASGLYFAHYNWVKRHGTLKKTPTVASGLADKPWSIGELIEQTMNYRAPTEFESS